MMYVKKKYAHLEAEVFEFTKMLQATNQQLGLAVMQALKERDAALAQVDILKEVLRNGRTDD
jgi:hypothetical protein